VNFVYLFFFAAAWAVIQCLIGGTRLLFSLPAYGLLAVGAVLTLASFRARRIPPSPLCLLSTLLLGAWVLIRASHSPIAYLALPDYYMMIGCLTAYLMTAYYFTSLRDRAVLIGVLWAIAALEVFCGLVQFLKDDRFMLFGLMRGTTNERASGMFISPNHFAGFLEAVAIISLSMAFWSRWPSWSKVLGIYIALSCWLGVAISGSRGGYFSTIITLVVFSSGSIYTIRLSDPRKFRPALICSLAAILLMVGLAAFLMSHSQLLTRRMQTMVVKDVRIYNWEAAIDHIRVSPWVGTGAGTHLIYGRLFRRSQIQADPVHAHCDYLELLAEYGIVGGLCTLFFLAAHVSNGLKAFSEILRRRLLPSGINRSNGFAMNFGALCAVAGLAAHSVVDFNMHIPGNALLFAFIFGMLANPGIERPPSFVTGRLLPWGRLLLPALGVWMIWAGLPLLPSEWCAEQSRIALRDNKYIDSIDYANLGLGRFDEYGRPPVLDPARAPFWSAWFGGIDSMVRRFGPNPRNPDLYFYLGEANRALGSRMPLFILKRRYYDAAVAAFHDGLSVFPQDENALVRLAQSLDGLRQYNAAEQVYQECFRVDPHLATMRAYYATHLLDQGKTSEAAAAVQIQHELETHEVDAEHKADSLLQ
jgi:O-antigen ligase